MRQHLGRLAEQAFALPELLVAMSITAIVVLGVSLSTAAVIRGNAGNDNFSTALNLAQDKMEELKASREIPFQNSCPAPGESPISASAASAGMFHPCWSITPSPLGNRLKQIDVTVAWHDREDHRIAVSTLVFTDGTR